MVKENKNPTLYTKYWFNKSNKQQQKIINLMSLTLSLNFLFIKLKIKKVTHLNKDSGKPVKKRKNNKNKIITTFLNLYFFKNKFKIYKKTPTCIPDIAKR